MIEETRALVGVWGQANVQSELDGVTRNRSIYARGRLAMSHIANKDTPWRIYTIAIYIYTIANSFLKSILVFEERDFITPSTHLPSSCNYILQISYITGGGIQLYYFALLQIRGKHQRVVQKKYLCSP